MKKCAMDVVVLPPLPVHPLKEHLKGVAERIKTLGNFRLVFGGGSARGLSLSNLSFWTPLIKLQLKSLSLDRAYYV